MGLVELDDVWGVTYAGRDLGLFEPGESGMEPMEKTDSAARTTM